jgi:hypothetical protein
MNVSIVQNKRKFKKKGIRPPNLSLFNYLELLGGSGSWKITWEKDLLF